MSASIVTMRRESAYAFGKSNHCVRIHVNRSLPMNSQLIAAKLNRFYSRFLNQQHKLQIQLRVSYVFFLQSPYSLLYYSCVHVHINCYCAVSPSNIKHLSFGA